MTSTERNAPIVEEFRANGGTVGGAFDGIPILLLHHRGIKTGTEYVAPVAYLAGPDGTVYVFASAGGRPANPQWYANVVATGRAEVEVGTERYAVSVGVLSGAERDRVYAEQAKAVPGFADYERKLAGTRTIPVLALHRVT